MKVISTRNPHLPQDLITAIYQGLAADGGLYVPQCFPNVSLADFSFADSYSVFAAKLLRYFFVDTVLESQLEAICQRAFNFDVPLKKLNTNTYLLELFHGPTGSFKDFGARFLAECLERLIKKNKKVTILVATSGDTGSAVASAFHGKSHTNVIVLFPKDKISERQQQQICCWGDNILAVAVQGTFDDCQRLVKVAYAEFQQLSLSTANSINLGRLLPQVVYYAYHAFHFMHRQGKMPGFIVPSGNLGNVTAAYWAKSLGFPIREIAIATNANQVLSDYLQTKAFTPRASITTLANAMDVGNPSNFERLQYLFNHFADFKKYVQVMSVDDAAIAATITEVHQQFTEIICPHTATAFFMRKKLSDEPWVIVATAEAAKFATIIEPIIKTKVPLSEHLTTLLQKKTEYVEMVANIDALAKLTKDFLQQKN